MHVQPGRPCWYMQLACAHKTAEFYRNLFSKMTLMIDNDLLVTNLTNIKSDFSDANYVDFDKVCTKF